MKNNEVCANCGGKLMKKTITYDQHWGEDIFLFEGVPAKVCIDCDAVWLDASAVEKIDRILELRPKPKRTREIPVWSLAS